MNLPTLIVGLVVAALVGCAVAGILRSRKKGGRLQLRLRRLS